MRVVVVPEGRVKTKPRALNLALDHCRGAIIGIYDAEDAPEPDQIRKVAEHFHRAAPNVACLQGMLDYYNPFTNWLSRCFTIEYATWFRLILPGIQRLGLIVPLGGTTLFFRRSVLEELGGWDAHNVTEDADLGIRLVRHGYRTEIVDTVTGEEANCRMVPWIKQRSRWIKGYMITWAVHMRNPFLLWRQVGTRAFIGFQIMFLGTILQFLLAPLMWSFWAIPLGFGHTLAFALSHQDILLMSTAFILSEAVNITLGIVALRRSGHRMSPLWVPTLSLYFPLAALAAYKGLYEAVFKPFYWDKTHHGIFDPLESKG
jgi:cellulose synthase/poly-beta-1,6-N-acetylglucosamine synthase-like glycosyltransferase